MKDFWPVFGGVSAVFYLLPWVNCSLQPTGLLILKFQLLAEIPPSRLLVWRRKMKEEEE